MKKLLLILPILAIFFISAFSLRANAQVETSARNAVLINGNTGEILYEKNAYSPHLIASITKIMTAIVAIEAADLDSEVVISEEAAQQVGSACPLTAGDVLTLRDLLYCLMLRSGNDAAWAIGEFVAGNVDDFVKLMNQKAAAIGMEQTEFGNPSGLDEVTENYSTAYDMAILMQYAMNNKDFRELVNATTYETTSTLGIPYNWINKHRLVRNVEWVVGGKTGFTQRARRTLVTVAEKDGVQLIAVTLNAPNDWEDHMNMFEYGFEQYGIEVPNIEPEQYLRKEENEDY
ncbi:D-alanyl-D-alanine carboxypeptidase family protein [Haloplasma contractile]|uniref:D-alanyl-D-alanine carboxypeptidase penicillin-binding protein 5-6 n=1 Tax=Haloplasma contractile SSD-17B TaxID=1033810 RepID=U2FJU1_9MOLU|nr:D-alanyl-D-alanine carboxypeptidase family protein [Haloplasma contractile]ERJ13085.1 D-alanyl-D-alanine carboxypeptidase penicillin-binding protein 5-6 [Haloplasma contractile SSD-17B]